ncbi:MAG: hypothetical protein ACXW30_04765 [Micavibrio sp.]
MMNEKPPPLLDNKKNPDQVKVVALYVSFIVSALLVFAPVASLSFLALLGMVVLIIVIGFMRRECEKDSLLHNHATYLSRTFWMWQLMLLVGMIIGGYYVFRQYPDIQQILRIVESLSKGQTDTPEFKTMATVTVVTLGPGCLYVAYRLIRGFHRALSGYRVAKPKSFF